MTALIIICAVFLACFAAMLVVYHHAMPYDPSWDAWAKKMMKR